MSKLCTPASRLRGGRSQRCRHGNGQGIPTSERSNSRRTPIPTSFRSSRPQRRRDGFAGVRYCGPRLAACLRSRVGLAVSKLIEDLYARSLALGWFGVALTAAAALALLVIVAREVRGLMKLSAIEHIRNKAIAAIGSDKRADGVAVAQDLLQLTRNAPALAHARRIVTNHIDDIIDGADMVRLI